MKACAVMAFLLGIFVYYMSIDDHYRQMENARAHILAENFSIYRTAVLKYIAAHPEEAKNMTAIAEEHFAYALPTGWAPIRNWTAHMHNGSCYLHGEATPSEVATLLQKLPHPRDIGIAQHGQLVPGATLLPSFIPDGHLVSIVRVAQ